MNLPKFSLHNQTIVMTAMFLAMVWGIIVFYTIPRNEDPVCHYRTCAVTTSWPGATAKKVEQLISIPLEQAISGLDEIRHIRSESMVGLSVIYVDLEPKGVKNLEEVWNKIRGKVSQVELPEGVEVPHVDTEYGSVEAMVLALYPLYSEKYSYEDLRKMAKSVKNELNTLSHMGRIQMFGVQEEVINLEVSSGIWSQLRISTDELAIALKERNVVAPGGSIDTKLGRYILRPIGEFKTTQQIERLVLGSLERKSPTYLRDMGIKVNRTYPQPPGYFCRYGEKEFIAEKCIVISFTMKRGGNIVNLGKRISDKLNKINKYTLPSDVQIAVVSNQPRQIEQSTKSFISNLIGGMFVVVAIGFLMVGMRLAIVMASAIPLVLISSIGTFMIFGIELEQVSVAALIVALGMVVDNAIEVSDNVHRLMSEGKSRFQASCQGASEIAIPILSATLTTVAAFLPMLIIPGEEGQYIYSLVIVVPITLMISWFISITVVTVLCYWLITPTAVQGGILSFMVRMWIAMIAILARIRQGHGEVLPFARRLWKWAAGKVPVTSTEGGGFLKAHYTGLLKFCLRHRYLALTIGILICLSSVYFSDLVGHQFFPLAFRDQFLVDIWLPASVPLHRTEEICKELESIIRNKSEITIAGTRVDRLNNMVSFIGKGTPRFYISIDPEPEMHNFAQIIVNTTHPKYTEQYIQDVRKLVNRQIVDARINIKKLNLGISPGAPIALRVMGEDSQSMRAIVDKIKKLLTHQQGVIDIYDDWGEPIYQLEVRLDEELANLAGVTNKDVARIMNTFLAGQYLTTFREEDRSIPVYLRLPKEEREAIRPLHNFYVDGRLGRVPLDGISNLDIVWGDGKIVRRNRERTMTVYANVEENTLANEVITNILPQIRELQKKIPEGYKLEIGGEWEDTQESEDNFRLAFNLSLILICLILVCQYNGIVKPIIILLTLPMAYAGSMFGLVVTGWPLNFMAILGLVSLSGMAVNDAIVLIDFIDKQLALKFPLEEAIQKAARMRFVPILLTSLTTAGGLFPLAVWGGPMWQPMATVIIFGLCTSTFLTLVIIPCVYYIVAKDLKLKMSGKNNFEEITLD